MMHTPNHRAILSTGRPAPMPSPKPAAVRRLLRAEPAMGKAEQCFALLLAKGVGGDDLAVLCGLTKEQLRDALESIETRIKRNDMRQKREKFLADNASPRNKTRRRAVAASPQESAPEGG